MIEKNKLFLILLNLKIKKKTASHLKNEIALKTISRAIFYNLFKFFLSRVILVVGRKLNYRTLVVYKELSTKKNILKTKGLFFNVNLPSIKYKKIKLNSFFLSKDKFFLRNNNYFIFKSGKQLKFFFLKITSNSNININYFSHDLRTLFYIKLFNFSLYLNKKIDIANFINKYRFTFFRNLKKKVETKPTKILFSVQVSINFFFSKFFFDYCFIRYNHTIKNIKKKCKFKLNLTLFLNYLLFIKDKNIFNNIKNNYNFISNKFLKNFFNFFDYNSKLRFEDSIKKKLIVFNSYYPLLLSNKATYKKFFSLIKSNHNLDYIVFTNKFVISFLEKNFKKKIFIKYTNNYYNKINNYYLDSILNDYKRFQPAYWKKFLVKDFIKILWYSFFLKDLSMIAEWISIFMESLHFKNHKKFLSFLSNFIEKYSGVFIDVLKIKGFFFDIRGKVGVTGSSKKRHFFFKFGSVNKSSKKTKINISQNLVRTYSGVLGLTYIINF